MTDKQKDDPVLNALRMADNALSGLTEDEVFEGRMGPAVMANRAIQKAIAIHEQELRVIEAARYLEKCFAEFPDYPPAWTERIECLEQTINKLDELKAKL